MTDTQTIHLGHKLDPATTDSIADIICGDGEADGRYPVYRSSKYITQFFQNAGINAVHDGSTRKTWITGILEQLQPSDLEKVILRLADMREYKANIENLKLAVKLLNEALRMDNLKVGYENNKPCLQRADPMRIDDDLVVGPPAKNESEFLQKNFGEDINLDELNLDAVLTSYLKDRVVEAQHCPRGKVSLGVIFLLGSTLEGILVAVAASRTKDFMSAISAPKDKKTGKTLKVYDWNLNQLIDTAFELKLIDLDVKKFSHALRDFRNYIHPYEQMTQSFKPNQHTVDICWQVFKAAVFELRESIA